MIDVILIPALKDNYIYILNDKESNLTACVDPCVSDLVLRTLDLNNLKLDFILNTHHHYDHVGGNLNLKQETNCKIIGADVDKKRIPGIDITIKNEETFKFGSSIFKVHETPGHTVGHIIYHFYEDKILFCGDTLFSFGCGRIFEGSQEQMWESLKLIKSFPNETLIYCGHEYTESNLEFAISLTPDDQNLSSKFEEVKKLRKKGMPSIPSRLNIEKKMNPFFRVSEKKFKKSVGLMGDDVESFKKIRKMKDIF